MSALERFHQPGDSTADCVVNRGMNDPELVTFSDTPVPHMVIDAFFTDWETGVLWDSARLLRGLSEEGKMERSDGSITTDPRKKNANIWLQDDEGKDTPYGKAIIERFKRAFESERFLQAVRSTNDALLQGLLHIRKWSMLLSLYQESGCYYGPHRDVSWLTCVLMLESQEGRGFQGGDFILGNFEHAHGMSLEELRARPEGEVRRIEHRNNRLLIFPGYALHAVEPITRVKEGFDGARITIQAFPCKL